jgi:hypothetical protein
MNTIKCNNIISEGIQFKTDVRAVTHEGFWKIFWQYRCMRLHIHTPSINSHYKGRIICFLHLAGKLTGNTTCTSCQWSVIFWENQPLLIPEILCEDFRTFLRIRMLLFLWLWNQIYLLDWNWNVPQHCYHWVSLASLTSVPNVIFIHNQLVFPLQLEKHACQFTTGKITETAEEHTINFGPNAGLLWFKKQNVFFFW